MPLKQENIFNGQNVYFMREIILMEIIKTLILDKFTKKIKMMKQNRPESIYTNKQAQKAQQITPIYIQAQKNNEEVTPQAPQKIESSNNNSNPLLFANSDASPPQIKCDIIQPNKRSFFGPNRLHKIRKTMQLEQKMKQQEVLQPKQQVNVALQQATHLSIDVPQKPTEDHYIGTKQSASIQTKLEPVNFIILVEPIKFDQADQNLEWQQKHRDNIQKDKKTNVKQKTSKQIIEQELHLTPVSFKIVLKQCKDMPISNLKEKEVTERDKTQKVGGKINKKSYLSSKIINKYPMTLKNVQLQALISEVYQNRLISMALYEQWLKNRKNIPETFFLQMFQSERLQQFPFNKIKFTLLDHRRLSQILISIFPQKYLLGDIKVVHSQQKQFIAGIYDIQTPQYYELCSGVDKISKIKWWLKLIIVHEDKLTGMRQGMKKKKDEKQAQEEKDTFQEFINIATNNSVNIFEQKKAKAENNYFRLNQTISSTDSVHLNKVKQRKIIRQKPKKGKQQQISHIRNLVSGFGNKRVELQQPQQYPRKKIKFS